MSRRRLHVIRHQRALLCATAILICGPVTLGQRYEVPKEAVSVRIEPVKSKFHIGGNRRPTWLWNSETRAAHSSRGMESRMTVKTPSQPNFYANWFCMTTCYFGLALLTLSKCLSMGCMATSSPVFINSRRATLRTFLLGRVRL